jgi:hypothetical protein
VSVEEVGSAKGKTDFVKVVIAGTQGRLRGGTSRTLGIIGRLGGLGARPKRIGLVSDGDGAVAAVATALKIARMQAEGDPLPGDVISTHVCPDAPTRPHQPVEFMDSPVTVEEMNAREVFPEMDALLSIDTTKGNRILNHRGFAISPTVKEGYILRVADDLVRIMETTTGRLAVTFPITMQDITPYGNDIYHINSILQPSVVTDAPVVGVGSRQKQWCQAQRPAQAMRSTLPPPSGSRSKSRRNSVERRRNFTTPRNSRGSMNCMARCTTSVNVHRAPE